MIYDVRPEDLRTGSRNLAADALEITGGCADSSQATATASGGVAGGPLTGALADLARAIGEVSTGTGGAVETAATLLTRNAERYGADDRSAAGALDQSVPEGGCAPPVFPGGSADLPRQQPWSGQPQISPAPWYGGASGPQVVPA